jgi:membrane-bound serine protease (ClpP class)
MDVQQQATRRVSARRAWALISAFLMLTGVAGMAASRASDADRVAVVLELDGAVSPATADYLVRGIKDAAERNAKLIVIRMDTPGGLDTSMRKIIRAILDSPVPVATYVAPSGARAASAGTYILYASHIAAMAPGTNLGAATPIAIGGFPFGGDQGNPGDQNAPAAGDKQPAAPRNAEEAKAVNDAVAYIRGLAELRHHNADWAEQAVRNAASLPSSAALKESVIDLTAGDIDELLARINGRTVQVGQKDVQLDTAGLQIEELKPDFRTEFLSVITDPNIALLLMMLGIYGLVFEFLVPGTFAPGTIGAISLLLGLYALALLPVNYAGLGLIILGAGLMAAEHFVPSGAFVLGGAVAFVMGAMILFDTRAPGMEISRPLLAGIVLAVLLFSLAVGRFVLTARRRKVVTGAEQMIGAAARVESWSGGNGYVIAHGERWKAASPDNFKAGDEVDVVDRKGLTLKIAARETGKALSPSKAHRRK